jgi:hypothetical protein
MATEPDTQATTSSTRRSPPTSTRFTGGDPTRTSPCPDLHPPGPQLLIGGALRFCAYCNSPLRTPFRRDGLPLESWRVAD